MLPDWFLAGMEPSIGGGQEAPFSLEKVKPLPLDATAPSPPRQFPMIVGTSLRASWVPDNNGNPIITRNKAGHIFALATGWLSFEEPHYQVAWLGLWLGLRELLEQSYGGDTHPLDHDALIQTGQDKWSVSILHNNRVQDMIDEDPEETREILWKQWCFLGQWPGPDALAWINSPT